jgi:hypothetical protein
MNSQKTSIALSLLLSFFLQSTCFAQTTLIPDANFEQELINLGYDTGAPDGTVLTASIDSVRVLNLNFKSLNSLVGLEDFAALERLYINHNQIVDLNITQNTALKALECAYNTLTSLDLTQNTNLNTLSCFSNQLNSLDISQNTSLSFLSCGGNQLNCLNLKNGNNTSLSLLATNNASLTCIEVDDSTWATSNWTAANFSVDSIASFSNNCNNSCSNIGLDKQVLLKLSVYPNPTAGTLRVNTDIVINHIAILSLDGVVLKQNQEHRSIDLTDLPSGIYIVRIVSGESIISKKIIKD